MCRMQSGMCDRKNFRLVQSVYGLYRAYMGDSDGIVSVGDYSWGYKKICIFQTGNETKSPYITYRQELYTSQYAAAGKIRQRKVSAKMKYLTITVPCFNSEKYLRRCMDSLIIGGNDVEIIVVDDGSTDQTGEIADLYAKCFPDIVTVVHKENGGHGSGVNTGLKLAKGRYFKVVDSDDWLEETAYRELLKKIKIW